MGRSDRWGNGNVTRRRHDVGNDSRALNDTFNPPNSSANRLMDRSPGVMDPRLGHRSGRVYGAVGRQTVPTALDFRENAPW
jgi:hypothetical protein